MGVDSKLYVGNLPYKTTAEDLRQLFGQAGGISDAMVILDRETHRSKGFGFVEMESAAEAQKAIQMFHDYDLGGRKLTVNVAKPRDERPRSAGA